MDILKDTRVNCYSVIVKMSVRDYLEIIKQAYENRGGID